MWEDCVEEVMGPIIATSMIGKELRIARKRQSVLSWEGLLLQGRILQGHSACL